MRTSLKVITLGVESLGRSLAFYRDGLGLPTDGVVGEEFEDGAVVFFQLKGGLILALYPTAALSKDARVAASRAPRGRFARPRHAVPGRGRRGRRGRRPGGGGGH